jgi:hypothetical protein
MHLSTASVEQALLLPLLQLLLLAGAGGLPRGPRCPAILLLRLRLNP